MVAAVPRRHPTRNRTARAGTYDGEVVDPAGRRAPAKLALVSFHPKLADPGALKRRLLYAPREVKVSAAFIDMSLAAAAQAA